MASAPGARPAGLAVLVQLLGEREPFEAELEGGANCPRLGGAELDDGAAQRRKLAELLDVLVGGHGVGDVEAGAGLERGDDFVELGLAEAAAEDVVDGLLDEPAEQLLLVAVADRLELDLADGGRRQRAEIAHARHRDLVAQPDRALERAGEDVLVVADAHAHGHARALADVRRLAGQVRQLGDDLLHVVGTLGRHAVVEGRLLGLHDRDLVVELLGIVRAHLGAEAVLERRDDAPAVRVVLGVGAGHHVEIERQPHLVAADLDVALLHDVEQADLDALGEVGQLVEREDAAMRARQQAVVDRQLVSEVTALGHLDGIDLADQIGDRDVGRGQLLTVAAVARNPLDGGLVTLLGQALATARADRSERIVVDLAAGQHRDLLVEQAHQQPRDARLGLAALAEKNDVLPGQDRVLDLRHDGVVVADDPGQEGVALPEPGDQIVAQLLLDRLALPASSPEITDRVSVGHERSAPLCDPGRALSTSTERTPHALATERHVEMTDAERRQRVHDGIDGGRRGADRRGLADALGAERVERRRRHGLSGRERRQVFGVRHGVVHERAGEQLAVLVVDEALDERLGDALSQASVHLARDDHRADANAAVVDRDEIAQGHVAGLAIHLDDGDVSAERVDELGRAEEVGGLEAVVDSGRQAGAVRLGRDLAERDDAVRHAAHAIAAVADDDVLGRRFHQMRGQTLGLVLHFQRRVEDRGAADGQAATAPGAVAHRRVEGVAVTDDDMVEVHAEVVGDDLGKGRLVTLAVGGRARERGDHPARLHADHRALEGPEAAHLDVARHADTEQVPIAPLQSHALLLAEAVDAGELQRLDRKSTRLNSSHGYISYAVFCLKKKKLLTIHGGLDHCRSWDWVATDLRLSFHIVAPDLRGHRDSACAIGSTSSLIYHVLYLATL